MEENDILNAIVDRRIIKAEWEDAGESVLILTLHDGLKVKIDSVVDVLHLESYVNIRQIK